MPFSFSMSILDSLSVVESMSKSRIESASGSKVVSWTEIWEGWGGVLVAGGADIIA